MKIGYNLLYLIPNKVGGTETYARGLIDSFIKHYPKEQIFLFCNRENYSTFKYSKNVIKILIPFQGKNRFLRLLLEQTYLSYLAWKYKIDLLHSLGYSCPFFLPCKNIVTIHDLNCFYHKEDFSPLVGTIWKIMIFLSAKLSNLVVTDSVSTQRSLISKLNIPNKKIVVVYPGISFSDDSREFLPREMKKFPYIFTVSAAYPHKNLITLLRSFQKLLMEFPQLRLIITGLPGSAEKGNAEYIEKNNLIENIEILGYVSQEKLKELYQNAYLFVFPSAYEGFGFPVLEAMSFNIPVISSNAFSLPELVGEAGILVDPYDVDSYVKAIKKIITNPLVRKDLINKGKKQVNKFDWKITAEKMYKVYQKFSLS